MKMAHPGIEPGSLAQEWETLNTTQQGSTYCITYVAPRICDTLSTLQVEHTPHDAYVGHP